MHVTAIFCEDIREEKNNTITLLGVMPDNIQVPIPGMFAKLGIYVRFHLEADAHDGHISINLRAPDGVELKIGEFEDKVVEKARYDAIEAKAPITGLIFTALASPFAITTEGRVLIIARIGTQDIVCGQLNIVLQEKDTA